MTELCEILNISINDLFSGEVVDMKDNEKKLEENLLEMTKLKEEKDKQLLALEWVIGALAIVAFFSLLFTAIFIEMEYWIKFLLISIGFIIFLVAMLFDLRIEQVAGYYECSNCHHKYIPTYKSVFLAQHMGRTRKMKCPGCGKKNWHKKVVSSK